MLKTGEQVGKLQGTGILFIELGTVIGSSQLNPERSKCPPVLVVAPLFYSPPLHQASFLRSGFDRSPRFRWLRPRLATPARKRPPYVASSWLNSAAFLIRLLQPSGVDVGAVFGLDRCFFDFPEFRGAQSRFSPQRF